MMSKTERHGQDLEYLETSEDTVILYHEDAVRTQWIESDYIIEVGNK